MWYANTNFLSLLAWREKYDATCVCDLSHARAHRQFNLRVQVHIVALNKAAGLPWWEDGVVNAASRCCPGGEPFLLEPVTNMRNRA